MGQGPVVRAIEVEYVGPPAITKARVLDNLATKVGAPYSERAAEADIAHRGGAPRSTAEVGDAIAAAVRA